MKKPIYKHGEIVGYKKLKPVTKKGEVIGYVEPADGHMLGFWHALRTDRSLIGGSPDEAGCRRMVRNDHERRIR